MPPSYDWRDGGWTTSIKDQGDCSSCAGFAAIAAIESQVKIEKGRPNLDVDLSEAHLFFCAGGVCNQGMYVSDLLDYAANTGVCTEKCFPYGSASYGQTLGCNPCPQWRDIGIKIDSWRYVNSNVYDIKNAVVKYGPLPAVMAAYDDFHSYSGGVYEHEDTGTDSYHAVMIVGYNDNQQYWICKNSWGSWWGEQGWFKIRFGNCEIEKRVYYIKGIHDLNPNNPQKPERPVGPTNVEEGDTGNYSTSAVDPNGDSIRFGWDWNGDGVVDRRTAKWYASGETCVIQHTWKGSGTYNVRVKAQDKHTRYISDWSNPLPVQVPLSWETNLSLKHFLQQLFPLLF